MAKHNEARAERRKSADPLEPTADIKPDLIKTIIQKIVKTQEIKYINNALVRQNGIPCPTDEQRARNLAQVWAGLRAGTQYAVPKTYPALMTAFRRGYIAPNLPPPDGFMWRGRAYAWHLVPRGG